MARSLKITKPPRGTLEIEMAVKIGRLVKVRYWLAFQLVELAALVANCDIKRNSDTREKLADLCHEQWSGWMKYLFGKGTFNSDGSWTMPPEFVERWQRQMDTPYGELSEPEQNSDRKEADKFFAALGVVNDA